MTPIEPPTPPRKRSWKRWTLALACVVAVITIALLASAPKQEPVRVWFVRATNELGVKELVFQGTNGAGREMDVVAMAFTGPIRNIKTVAGPDVPYSWTNSYASPGTTFDFALNAPTNGATYFVMWAFDDAEPPPTRWRRFRARYHDFFSGRGMYRLANIFYVEPQIHYIPSSEIKE